MTHEQFEVLSNQAVAACAVVYFLALLFCSSAVVVAISGNESLGLALIALQALVVFAVRRFGMARQAKEIAAERLEALRLRGPSWLPFGDRFRRARPASPDADPRREPGSRADAAPASRRQARG